MDKFVSNLAMFIGIVATLFPEYVQITNNDIYGTILVTFGYLLDYKNNK